MSWQPQSRAATLPGFAVLTLMVLSAAAASACDICAVYTATELQESRLGLRLGIAEQFSHFGTLQDGGSEVDNPNGERIDSSITQVVVGYAIHPRLSLQLNTPIIVRDYRRLEAKGTVSGEQTGVGDISLNATGVVYSHVDETRLVRLSGLFGIKLPTGNSHRLEEEVETSDSDVERPAIFEHRRRWLPRHSSSMMVHSGVHGHDLALGSGSADVLFGGQALFTQDRFFVTAALQYSVRTEGAFGYQYANELTASGGPGAFVLLDHRYSLGLQAVVTTETKGNDSLGAVKADDTAITSLYAGPGFHFTWGTQLSADLVADLPAIQNNSGLQIVPDYRLRGGVVWRF